MSSPSTSQLVGTAIAGAATGVLFAYAAIQNKKKQRAARPKGASTGSPAKEGERTYLIGGNWKCNGTMNSAKELIEVLNNAGPIPANVEVAVAAPYIHLGLALTGLREDIAVSAQNCALSAKPGAYTGEICASQLLDMGVTWVIIGHSERREGFGMAGEDSELVAKKVKVAVDSGLKVMFAIGEKKEEREKGITLKVCAEQLSPAAKLLTEKDWENVAIAYEPVWAIGTGLTATPEMAQETHAGIRKWMADNVSPAVAKAVRIQYGGSMKGANAKDLLAQPDIDGGLVGGASLKADFFNIITAAPSP